MKKVVSRRNVLLGGGAFVGATLANNYSISNTLAQTSDPVLEVYVLAWKSYGGNIPWHSSSPREVAEKAAFVIWSYIQTELYERAEILYDSFGLSTFLNSLFSKGSIIGHAALYAKFKKADQPQQEIYFSNTGGNVGFYQRWIAADGTFNPLQVNPRFPSRRPYMNTSFLLFDQEARVMVCCYPLEVLAGHLNGRWETADEFQKRLLTRRRPRINKRMLTGIEAENVFSALKNIKVQTSLNRGPGGPVHYGLNTLEVRPIESFDQPLSMRTYPIQGQNFPIWGGCANAVASVLRAVNLADMIPASAKFTRQLSYSALRNAAIPILIGPQAFDAAAGRTLDPDLLIELERLPSQWGTENTVEFYDPNYWYDSLPSSSED